MDNFITKNVRYPNNAVKSRQQDFSKYPQGDVEEIVCNLFFLVEKSSNPFICLHFFDVDIIGASRKCGLHNPYKIRHF